MIHARRDAAKSVSWALAAAAIVVLLLANGCGATSRPSGMDLSTPTAERRSVMLAQAAASTAALINHTAPATDLFGAQWCGATLTTATTLVTARHCVQGRRAASLDVVLGADNLCNTAPIGGERIQLKTITIVADATLDLAVLTTTRPARTKPAPIATIAGHTSDAVLVAVGWGSNTRNGVASCTKQTVQLRPAGPEACSAAQAANPEQWNSNQLCATGAPGAKRNTCTGDSGGPVYQTTPGRPDELELVAVINWGTGCEPDQPGFYTPASLSSPMS